MKQSNPAFRFTGIQVVTLLFAITVVFAAMLCPSKAFAASDELEPNNTFSTANNLTIGTTIYGTHAAADTDLFKIVAPLTGTLKVTYQPTAFVSQDLRCHIYDSNGNRLVDGGFTGLRTTTPVTFTYGVVYGKTYYLWMGSYYSSCVIPYKFTTGYEIQPTSITKVKGAKKAFTVKWEKKTGASFYQVRYTKKSTWTDYRWSKAKVVKVSKAAKSKKIAKLKKNTKYVVQVRVARTIAGKTYYSPWTSKKTVKTK